MLELPRNYDAILISTAGIAELSLLFNRVETPVLLYVHTPLRAACYEDILWNMRYRFRNPMVKAVYRTFVSAYNFLERRAWKRISRAVFNSELSRRRALRKGLFEEEKTAVIYPGVDTEKIYSSQPESFFLYVARIGMAKRQDILIDAFSSIAKKESDVKLVLVGSLENVNYYKKLLLLIKRRGLKDRVKILTNVPYSTLLDVLSRCMCFVNVPFLEDFGIAPIEAMAAGKFVISVFPSGNYEVLKHAPGVMWIREKFYREKMVEEVKKALEAFLKNREELIERGRENRKYVRKLGLTWDSFTSKLDKEIESVVEEKAY